MTSTDTMRAYGPASDTATAVPDFARAVAAIDALAATDPLLVHPDELPEGLKQLQALPNKLATVRARWIAASQQRNADGTERHSKWLSGQLGVDGDVAAKDAAVAKTVEAHEPVAKSAEAGEISPDHVRAIGRAAGTVEDEHEAALVDELVAYAKDHTPEQTAGLIVPTFAVATGFSDFHRMPVVSGPKPPDPVEVAKHVRDHQRQHAAGASPSTPTTPSPSTDPTAKSWNDHHPDPTAPATGDGPTKHTPRTRTQTEQKAAGARAVPIHDNCTATDRRRRGASRRRTNTPPASAPPTSVPVPPAWRICLTGEHRSPRSRGAGPGSPSVLASPDTTEDTPLRSWSGKPVEIRR